MNTNELKALYTKSCNLISPYVHLEGEVLQRNPDSEDGKRDLKEGIDGLKFVIEESETNWAAQWFLGKAYQCMSDHENSYQSFLMAYRHNLTHQDILRELALECLLTDRFNEAAYYCNVAIEFDPDDHTLWSNMSVAQLFNKKLEKAESWANKTLAKIPEDKPALEVLKYVNGVKLGTMTIPEKFSMFV